MRIALVCVLCLAIVLAIYAVSGKRRGEDAPMGRSIPAEPTQPGLLVLDEAAATRAEASVDSRAAADAAADRSPRTVAGGPLLRRAGGQVFDPLGRPVPAELLLLRPGGARQRTYLQKEGRVFHAGRDGRFLLESDARGDFALLVMDGSTGWATVPLGVGSWPTDLKIQLEPLPYVRGRVVGVDGTPRAAVVLDLVAQHLEPLQHNPQDLPSDLRRKRFTALRPDGDGRFAIGPLAPGEYRLRVQSDGPHLQFATRFFEPTASVAGGEPAELLLAGTELTPPTTLTVRADLDAAREVVVQHASTEVWVHWFDPGSAGEALSLTPWDRYGADQEAPSLDAETDRKGALQLRYYISTDSPWRPEAIPVDTPLGVGLATLVLAVHPESSVTVHGCAFDVPVFSRKVQTPFAGQRVVVEMVVPARVRSVPVRVTTISPEGAQVSPSAGVLKRVGDFDETGLPLRLAEGKTIHLPEARYTLRLQYQVRRASGSSEKVFRDVDLNLHGAAEFHTTVDLRP